ncbi:hypothetical protein [Streptomyces fractus]|uniref:hypothetical protein n=1 Tax=Streptomyces fractus TaxID=641806 RepID=UPI003CFA3F48
MAPKKHAPAARRAREAARRAAATERIGPRPVKTPRRRTLYSLNPPGAYYRDWGTQTGTDEEVIRKVNEAFGADSGEATMMRLFLGYRDIYGPNVPMAAASHLDVILQDTGLADQLTASMGSAPDDVWDSLHSLHSQGTLLVADDGSLWMTIPPATPYSTTSSGQWTFVEQKVAAPAD